MRYTNLGMHSITIDNEKYVKATDIARELGYTADYVGQLCRAKKVDAQLVGRSWYVSESSIRHHKKNRYRSTAKKDRQHIKTNVGVTDTDGQDPYPIRVSYAKTGAMSSEVQPSFYTRVGTGQKVVYTPDDSDLIPTTSNKKTGVIKVQLGDAHSVSIKAHSKEFDFVPEPQQELRFQGTVKVRPVYDDNDISQQKQHTDTTEINQKKKHMMGLNDADSSIEKQTQTDLIKANKKSSAPVKPSKIKVKHLRKERKKTNKKHLPLERNTAGIIGMTSSGMITTKGTLTVPKSAIVEEQISSYIYFVYIATFTSILFAFLMIGMQASVFVQGVEASFTYTFTLENIAASIAFLQ